jgi:hypothetical protein
MKRWRGLKRLVKEAVDHGSRAVEKVQIETARLPFDILEQIPPLRGPVKGIRVVHNLSVAGVHGAVRLVNHLVGEVLEVVIDVVDSSAGSEKAKAADKGPPAAEAKAADKGPPAAEAPFVPGADKAAGE